MNIQDYLHAAVQDSRNKSFANSNQLTLGEIIDKLESIIKSKEEEGDKDNIKVDFDFGSAYPTTLDSWRGAYNELALGYALSGYDASDDNHFNPQTAQNLLKHLQEAVGKTYTGWKGGDYVMSRDTPVWVANPGNSDNTGIVELVDNGWRVIIMTQYCEF